MAGHSKWANRQYRKGRQDAARGKLFSRCSREIIVAARQGGGDPDKNTRLRLAIQAAKDANVPADTIQRAIKRGTGELEGVDYEEATYEGYGPGGVALMIQTLSDNQQRTVAALRNALGKRGGNMGVAGCTAYLFEPKGIIFVDKSVTDEDTLMEAVLDAGAEDVLEDEDQFEVRAAPADFQANREAVERAGIEISSAELTMIPSTTTPVPDDQARSLLKLLQALDDEEDVQKVYANFEVSDDVLAEMSDE